MTGFYLTKAPVLGPRGYFMSNGAESTLTKTERDLSLAYRFCNTLGGEATSFRWRAIPESPEAKANKADEKKRMYDGVLKRRDARWQVEEGDGTAPKIAEQLCELNDRGFGIFIVVNTTDGRGGKAANVNGLRALYVDKDDGRFKSGEFKALSPNIIVASVNGDHAYWLLHKGEDLERFTPAQKHLIRVFGTDSQVHDLPRVMRVPGFLHCKAEPTLVVLSRCEPGAVGIDDVLAAYPAPPHVDQDRSEEESRPITTQTPGPVKSDRETMVLRARQYLDTIPGTTEHTDDGTPGRNTWTTIAANKVGDFVDVEDAIPLMREFNQRNTPPLDDEELEKTVRSAYRSRQRPVGWRAEEVLTQRKPMAAVDFFNPVTGECHPSLAAALGESDDVESPPDESFGPKFGKVTGDFAGQLFIEHRGRDIAVNNNDQVFLYSDSIWRAVTKYGLKSVIVDDMATRKIKKDGRDVTPTCGVNALKTAADRVITTLHRKEKPIEWNLVEDDEIPFVDGVYDVVHQTMRPHARRDMLDKTLPHKFPDAAMPPMIWLRCLHDWFPPNREANRDKVNALQEFMGYCLLGHARYKKAAVLFGESNTGKSIVLKVIGAMVGVGNTCSIKLEDMSDPRKVAGIKGKMVNIVTEIDDGALMADGGFKQLVSTQEPIQIDPKYVAPYIYFPTCKHIFATNNLPIIHDRTNAVFNRLMICTFDRVFGPDEIDEDLDHKLLDELPSIMMWAIEGAERLVAARGRFTRFQDSDDVITEYRERDPLMTFIDECCVDTGNMRDGIEIGKFTAAFNQHKGGKAWTRQAMGALLANLPGTDKRYKTERAKKPGARTNETFVPGVEFDTHVRLDLY